MGAALRRLGIHHRAQFQIARQGRWAGRSYYLDFALPDQMIAIECDGAAYHSTKRQKTADARRQAELERLGWTFLRFTGSEIVTDIAGCEARILSSLRGIQP
jgi:very-short-patch-repair endonuclease